MIGEESKIITAERSQMTSSNQASKSRASNAILGALVADAATMGTHWLYSQKRIAELAPECPEFRAPNEQDYAGNVGYFAHGMKNTGELSHYGEQCLTMLDSLATNSGEYEKSHYQEQFRSHFGYGGKFVGYIDRPTRETLDNIYQEYTETDVTVGQRDDGFGPTDDDADSASSDRFAAAANACDSTARVSTGSITPSSQRRALE